MATLSMVSAPIATSSLPLSTRGRSSSLSFPAPKIECIRIGGVEIPNHKRVEYSLQYIHGIGRSCSRQILLDLNFDNKVTKDLAEEVINLHKEVSKYMIGGDLKRFNRVAIERLKEIRCYRGIRHKLGLPVRGQRTKNNCRTQGKEVYSCQEEVIFLSGRIRHIATVLFSIPSFDAVIDELWGYMVSCCKYSCEISYM